MGHNRNIKKVQSVSQVELLLYVFIKCPMSQYKIESCWVGPQAAGEAGRVPVRGRMKSKGGRSQCGRP